MSYKITEKNGVKYKVWSSVEEDFLSHVGGGEQDTATLFESATVGVPTVLHFGILDALKITGERVFEFTASTNKAIMPEFTFLSNRLILRFDLKKHIPLEYKSKVEGIKKCIVARESNFDNGLHRNSYSNITTSSILNLQQNLQFLVQEDYNESIRLHDRLELAGGASNYALDIECFENTGKVIGNYMVGKTYIENGNTMTGYITTGDNTYYYTKDAFFGLPDCILEAIYINNGYLIFHLYRPNVYANISHELSMKNKGKEFEFNVYLDINDLK